ncbi:MAG: heat-inducible transcriptional repressor HrcA [Nostocoides sp.]
MSEERRLTILRAIVQDFVETNEPVGSKALLERHRLGVSAATVRNEMAALEDEGLIAAPHTSAGRIPTDAGYRLFVDQLSEVRPLSRAERTAITEFLDGAVDLDDVIDRTVRLLASLTHHVAVVQYPSLSRSTVRHVELVAIAPSRIMMVLILNTGRVEQRIVDVDDSLDSTTDEVLSRIRAAVNAATVGQRLSAVAAALAALPERFEPADRDLVRAVTSSLTEALAEEREERVVLAGTANLARNEGLLAPAVAPVLEALEQNVVLLRLLGSVGASHVAVRIGQENPYAGLRTTSMITTGYGTGKELVAGLGVLGPTRMDYPGTMAAVRAVASYLSGMLAE